jgi:hypothetical protein
MPLAHKVLNVTATLGVYFITSEKGQNFLVKKIEDTFLEIRLKSSHIKIFRDLRYCL